MLTRLLAGLVGLLLAVAAAVTLPLAGIVADRATQDVYSDRLADADRYATLADRALRDGRTAVLADELRRYQEVFGIRAWLLGVDGRTILPAGDGAPPDEVRRHPDVDLALRGVQPAPPEPVTPFTSGDLLVAVPIGTGAETVGALVTLSPAGCAAGSPSAGPGSSRSRSASRWRSPRRPSRSRGGCCGRWSASTSRSPRSPRAASPPGSGSPPAPRSCAASRCPSTGWPRSSSAPCSASSSSSAM